MRKIIFYHVFFIQFFCLTSIALITSYKLPDLSEANWDTVLFLTPLGIIKNFMDKSPVLRSFYFDYSKGQVSLSISKVIFLILFIAALIGIFIKLVNILREKDI